MTKSPPATPPPAPPAPSGNLTVAQLASTFKKASPAVAPASPEAAPPPEPGSAGPAPVEHAREPGAEPTAEPQTPAGPPADPGEPANAEPQTPPLPEELTAKEDDESESESESENALSGEVSPKTFRKLKSRVEKLTANLRLTENALAKANALIAQTTEKPAPTAPPPAAGPDFAGHPVVQQLATDLGMVERALAFAEENPDGGEYTDAQTGAKTYYDAAQVRLIRRNAERHRIDLSSERAAVITQLRSQHAAAQQQYDALFAQHYPALAQPESPDAQELAEILRQTPELRKFPNHKLWIAFAIEGRKAFAARIAKGNGNGNGSVIKPMAKPRGGHEPTPVVAASPTAAPRAHGADQALQAAQQEFERTGSAKSYAKLLSQQHAARLQR